MGGKVAMALTQHLELNKLVVLDMAPVAYTQSRHDNVFAGLQAVDRRTANVTLRRTKGSRKHIEIDKFLDSNQNLCSNQNKASWNGASTLRHCSPITRRSLVGNRLIKPRSKPYSKVGILITSPLSTKHAVQQQFSNAKAHVIANTGHWLRGKTSRSAPCNQKIHRLNMLIRRYK